MSEGSKTRHVRDVHDILSDIISIKKDADKKGDTTLPIAALSNYDRDSWTEARKELLELGNDYALNLIDSAMFCLTLDDYEGKFKYRGVVIRPHFFRRSEMSAYKTLLFWELKFVKGLFLDLRHCKTSQLIPIPETNRYQTCF